MQKKGKGGLMQNKIIAVTGGIGTGKSLALSVIKESGFSVIDCDAIVKELYKKRKVKNGVKNIFPSAVKGKLRLKVDKTAISSEAFANPEKHRALTEFFAQKVLDIALSRAKKTSGKTFIEVPLLFELGRETLFDGVVVITRNLEDRISSVIKRSNLTREQVIERINCQFYYENADLSKYAVIKNDGTKEEFKEKVLEVIKKI